MLCKNCIVFFWINSKYDAKRFVNGHPDSEWNVNGVTRLLESLTRLVILLQKKVLGNLSLYAQKRTLS